MNIKIINNNTNNEKDKNVLQIKKFTRAKYLIEKIGITKLGME